MRELHPTVWKFSHFRRGELLWESDWQENFLTDEGEQDMLEVYFRAGSAPTNFYMGLINDSGIAETDTLATMAGEPSGSGYSRQLTTFGATALNSGDYQTVGTQETFTASGGTIGPVDHAFITDVASGTAGQLLVVSPLAATRTLLDGDSLLATVTLKQS